MPEVVRHIVDLVEARPLTCAAAFMAAVTYLNFMLSGPRIR
jgi:hypothetical protein